MRSNRTGQGLRFQATPKAESEGCQCCSVTRGPCVGLGLMLTEESMAENTGTQVVTRKHLKVPREMAPTGTQTGSDHVPSTSPDP